jgi:DNA-binding transcriptional ArsR family regulator
MRKHVAMLTELIHTLPDQWRNVSSMFVALGDEQRQRILLTFEPGERLNVTQIVSASTLSRTAVSHHLKVLRQAGALQSEKIGKEVYFWIDRENIAATLQRVLDYVSNNT